MTRIGMMAALLVGCGASAQPAPVERALPARDRPLEAEITEVFRVGTLDGDAWEAFGHVRAVDFGPDGELYILDQQAALVHGVSATGAYLGPIGRRGEGPGEFRVPTGLLVAPDGRILVRDTGAGTWTVFGPDGGYLENLRLDGSLARPSTLKVATDGTLIGLPNELRLVRNGRLTRSYLVEGGQAPDHVERLPLVAFDDRGGSPRVIDRLWLAPREVGENGRLLDVAFLPSPLFDVLPDGRAVVVDSVAWQVRLVGGHRGGTPERLTRPIEPRRVTDRTREMEFERRAAARAEGRSVGGGGAVAFGGTEEDRRERLARLQEERLRAGLGFPRVRPVIRDVSVDAEGRIWVWRTPEAVDPDAPGPVDLLDPSGRYLGTVESMIPPDAFGPDGLAAWIEEGALGVPIVTVRRIRLR